MLTQLKTALSTLTPSERKVANFIIQQPTEVSYLTIQQLADNVGTSTTTIMRLSAKLGYSGFAELQNALQAFLKSDSTPKSRLMSGLTVHKDELWGKTLAHYSEQIAHLLTVIDKHTLDGIVERLTNANKILITSARSGLPIGLFLAQNLNRLCGNAQFLQADLSDWVDDVLTLSKDDVLIAISFPRYAKRIAQFASVAKQKGATLVVLTDNYTSPLVAQGDFVVPCNAQSLSFHNSPITAMIVADYLIGAVAKQHASTANDRLGEVEGIFRDIGYHL